MSVYRNPIQRDDDFADPFVLRHDGRYYLYATNPDIRCWSSDDLLHWRSEGPTIAPDTFPGLVPFAPEVVYADGAFFMYTSPSGHGHHVLRSESPTGPFRDVSGNVGHAIDGNVLIDDDGRWYFYWAGDEGIWGCEMPSPTEFGEPVLTGIHMNGWTEGPFVSRRSGRYHMTLTGNHYLSRGYRIDAAFSDHPLTGWTAGPTNPLVVSTAEGFRGLGHSSSVTGPDLVSTYLVYHNMNPDLTRHLDIDRQVWNDAALQVLGPSRAAPAPAAPDARCVWEHGADADWTVLAGTLDGRDGHGLLGAGSGGGAGAGGDAGAGDGIALWSVVPTSELLTAELSLTAVDAERYGIICEGDGAGDGARDGSGAEEGGGRLLVLVDRSAHRVTASRGRELIAAAPLPPAFAHDALHAWRLVAGSEGAELSLDGRRQLILPNLGIVTALGAVTEGGAVRIGRCAATAATPESADAHAVAPVPGRLWATLSPSARPVTQAAEGLPYASVPVEAGEELAYRLHAATAGEYLLHIAGRFAAGDALAVTVDAAAAEPAHNTEPFDIAEPVYNTEPAHVAEDCHVVTIPVALAEGGNVLRIEARAGGPILTLLTVVAMPAAGVVAISEAGIVGFGKEILDTADRADVDVSAIVSFTPDVASNAVSDAEGGHGDLLLRVREPAEGGEGDDTRLGIDFLLGYSVQFHADRLTLARHDYDERVLATCPVTIDPARSYAVLIRLRGERLSVELDGVVLLEVRDLLPHATGATGIRAAGGSLRVERLEIRITDAVRP